jgi:hypothetical protein
MVNDGGDESLQLVAEKYHATTYKYAPRTSKHFGIYFDRPRKAMMWMERVLRAAQDTDWLLILEDDVLIHAPTNLSRLEYDLNGLVLSNQEVNPLYIGIVDVLREWGLDLPEPLCYSGLGGTFVRAAKLREIGTQHDWRSRIPRLVDVTNRLLASDQLLSTMVYMAHGTVGNYPGFVADDLPVTAETEVEHGNKSLYGDSSLEKKSEEQSAEEHGDVNVELQEEGPEAE